MFIARCITIKYSNFFKLGTTLLVVICLVISFSFPISAYSGTDATSISVPMDKPAYDESHKYMEVITRDSNGSYSVFVICYVVSPVLIFDDPSDPSDYWRNYPRLSGDYLDSHTIRVFISPTLSNRCVYSYTSYYFNSNLGSSSIFKASDTVIVEGGEVDGNNFVDHTFSSDIVAINYYGFNINSDSFPPVISGSYVINYSSDGLIVGYLKKIFDYLPGISTAVNSINTNLLSSNGYLSQISNYSNTISSYVSSIDSNISSIYTYMNSIDSSVGHSNNFLSSINDYLSSVDDSVSYIKDLVSSIDRNTESINMQLFYLSNISTLLSNIDGYLQYFNYLYGPESLNYFGSIDSTLKDILDGWSTPDDYVPPEESSPPRNDDTVDEIIDAESEALGGKTDEEIKEEVNDSVDAEQNIDKIEGEEIDEGDVIIVHNVFDIVLDCCGGKWRTFFVLNLTLAFACFVIGRRF